MNNGKQPPEGGHYPAESAEQRGLTKGNTSNPTTAGTQRPGKVPSGLERVREMSRRDRRVQFTVLLHRRFTIRRIPIAKRQRRKLHELKRELRRRFNRPVPETGLWLRQVLQGYYQYFAVPNNLNSRLLKKICG